MALKKLKKAHGRDAQAFLDDSSGKDNLRAILADMAKAGPVLTATLATIVTGQLNAIVFPFPVLLVSLTTIIGGTGSGGQTDVDVMTSAGTLATTTTLNTEPNNTAKTDTVAVEVPANTEISLEVSAQPTSGSALTATVLMQPIEVE